MSSNLKGSRLKVCSATWVLVDCRCSQVNQDWQSHSLHSVSDSYSPYVGLVLIILAVVSVVSKNLVRMCFVVIHWLRLMMCVHSVTRKSISQQEKPGPHVHTHSVASARYIASSHSSSSF